MHRSVSGSGVQNGRWNIHEDSNDSENGENASLLPPMLWNDFINGHYSESEAIRKALALSIEESSNISCSTDVSPALRVLFAIFQLPVTPKKSCKDRCEPHAIVVSDGMNSDNCVEELSKTFQGLSSPSKEDRLVDLSVPRRKRQLYRTSSDTSSSPSDSSPERTPITCDLSSCHQHVPGIFHGRTDPITNDEVLELMASQNSQHLSSSVQVRRVSCNVSFLISTKNLTLSDAAVDAMGVWKLSKSKRKNCRGQMVR
ncbi:unnamed protein product [Porites evermanni]|uniref:Uncharacterized protein n=1 Tax=Porites evermanni TaxID=104178 RepID=A0ABN8PG40_9CNID|nr:unnamed protein product [Porites evermanni]